MAQLRDEYDQFIRTNTTIVVIGPENEAAFKRYWQENELPFIGLPDSSHQVLKLYGQEVNLFRLGRMPAMLIIDQTGKIRYVHYGKAMSDIPENGEVLKILTALSEEEES